MGGAVPRPTGVPRGCEAISDLCPVEGTIYGYFPSLPANAFFAGFFGIAMIINIFFGIKYKTWTYMVAVALGCLAECGGYVGRVLMNNNPWNDMAFNIQIVLLIFAPSFLAAGIYLTLKHVVLQFGEEWSRLRPNWYTYVFIACDVSSLAMQSAGGAMAAMADPGESIGDIGTNLMIAGIIWQVVGKSELLVTYANANINSAGHFRLARRRIQLANLQSPAQAHLVRPNPLERSPLQNLLLRNRSSVHLHPRPLRISDTRTTRRLGRRAYAHRA
jgi:hypothetical protein